MKDNDTIPALMPGATPFFYPAGRRTAGTVGCLVVHGFGASPDEVRWLGQHLAGCGFTTYGPRLSGHGLTDYRAMQRSRWQDWYADALAGYMLLREHCDKVFVSGLSMGGLLALLLAATQAVDGVIVMAAPVGSANSQVLNLARLLKRVRPFFDAADKSDFPARLMAAQLERGEPGRGRVRYDRWAYGAVEQLYRLIQVADARLPQVQAPALLLYSEADKTVAFTNLAHVQGRIGSTQLETTVYRQSGHILTQDVEREAVLQRVADFIEKTSQ